MNSGSRTPAQRLACLALASPDRVEAETGAMQPADWEAVLELASAWRLVPQLIHQLDAASARPPDAVAARLRALEAAAAAHSAMVCQVAARALQQCTRAGVTVAAFKGVAAIAGLYGSPARRMVNDADVLLRPSDLEAALAAFRQSGFVPEDELDLQRWSQVLEERVLPFHDYVVLTNAHGVEIDVHWRIAVAGGRDLALDDLLARCEPVRLQRSEIYCLDPLDASLLTMHHSMRDRFRPNVTIKDLYDQLHWLGGLAQSDVKALVERASAWGLHTALLASWIILARYNPHTPAAGLLTESLEHFGEREQAVAGQLADYFELQLRVGAVSESMLGLSALSPAMLRRFVSSRWRRLTDQSTEAREVREHVEGDNWRAFRRLMRDLVTLTPARYRMYRTMARENRRMAGDGD